MTPSVYLETTIPSYLTAWRSRDLIKAAHQEATHEWWDQRNKFMLYISQLVVRESAGGDPEAARDRLRVLDDIPLLDLNEPAESLARDLVESGPVPAKAAVDALHIAIATVHGMDYLLTWNCSHIANATMRSEIELVCQRNGLIAPIICTPIELMEV